MRRRATKDMQELLKEINLKTIEAGGELCAEQQAAYRLKYRQIISAANEECPPPKNKWKKEQRGRLKKTKPRNMLERLRDDEDDVLRFMGSPDVPFTNNQGERDIRMTTVQQNRSGCFRSFDGALTFCRVRSYLSTCKKHNISATTALSLLFEGMTPDFDSCLNQPAE